MGWLVKLFTWWNGATLGTLLFTKRRGVKVGEDEQGNIYYEEKSARVGRRKRRWVTYNGTAEASRVPPDWHGWLHFTFDEPPTKEPFKIKSWEKDHVANLTGTPYAYRPQGSLGGTAQRPHATGDYEAWQPD
jgi:NADH:ubiquinone oxidoreductase subunit